MLIKHILLAGMVSLIISCNKDGPKRISPMAVDSLVNHNYVYFLDLKTRRDLDTKSPLKATTILIENENDFLNNSEIKDFIQLALANKKKIIICCSGKKTLSFSKAISNKGIKTMYFETAGEWEKAGLPLKVTSERGK